MKRLAQERYESLLSENGLTAELAAQLGITEPETYVLTRSENAGYVSFENDTSIVSGVANIFPVFFILIAMLVCITTMTRMVDEKRTQIGVLKAMGFGNGAITAKYLLYAGSATLLGWVIGFFLGTWGLPKIFWLAYSSLYDFAPLSYLFSPSLALLTLAVSLVGILGSTLISCRKELGSAPAKLIRPRAAKTGKRILLERLTPMWKRLPFLQKITLRNMFRYKRRLIMMLVGISSLSCLNYIIWLIVLFSGALAFIVIFNLTNINLAERSREIATVEVLGFYPKESESYVLRENLILSVLASLIGLPLGTLFHRIVMGMIVIDSMAFDIHVTATSYVLAFVCTMLFAAVVNLFMKRQLSKIPMAESLKAVE